MLVTNEANDVLEVPHEPGQTIEIRRLSWPEMDEALEENTTKQVNSMKKMGSELIEAIMSTQKDIGERREKRETKLSDYDRGTLLRKAVVAWSYTYEQDTPDQKHKKGEGIPCNEETIKGLDAKTAQWLAQQIYDRNREETADERLEGTSPSTAS